MGIFPIFGMKIKTIWNRHLVEQCCTENNEGIMTAGMDAQIKKHKFFFQGKMSWMNP